LIEPLSLDLVTSKSDARLWKAMVSKFHYLGYTVSVGRSLRFFLHDGSGAILGAIAVSDASWAQSERDYILNALKVPKDAVINNTRFLILPNIQIKNLASRALSLLATKGISEWESYYASSILMLETYVDPAKYLGTCYKAANWTQVGRTKGYSKRGNQHLPQVNQKILFLYPTTQALRLQLREVLLMKGLVHA
jgi:hypothetical protein